MQLLTMLLSPTTYVLPHAAVSQCLCSFLSLDSIHLGGTLCLQ